MTHLRLGTRGSPLALAQSQIVAGVIREHLGHQVEIVPIRSLGDDLAGPLAQAPEPGVFASALRDALMSGEVDVVVHSMKDLPAAPVPGITLIAVPEREDPRDVLVSHQRCTLGALPARARVGTSSPRRASQVQRLRPDIRIVDMRGNVDTRIDKVRSGEIDAAILAAAGVKRLNRSADIDEFLSDMVPAPSQGALAVEIRSTDRDLAESLTRLDDAAIRRQVVTERAVLAELAATCTSAVAAYAEPHSGDLVRLTAEVGGSPSAEPAACSLTVESVVPLGADAAAIDLGTVAARTLLRQGAGSLLADGSWREPAAKRPAVWVTRPISGAASEVHELRSRGVAVLEAPVLSVAADPDARSQARELLASVASEADLLAVTSAAVMRALVSLTARDDVAAAMAAGLRRGMRCVAVGSATARQLEELGATEVLIPAEQDSDGMLAMLGELPAGMVVLPRGNLTMKGLAEGLDSCGWSVKSEQVYLTQPIDPPLGVTDALVHGALDGVVLRSPSGVRAVRDCLVGRRVPDECWLIAGGNTTAAAIERDWPDHYGRILVVTEPSPSAVADLVQSAWTEKTQGIEKDA